ncbi:MAG: GNAT family N-acetyltransferase [Thermoplasmata archaeon]
MGYRLRKAKPDEIDKISELWYELAVMHEDIMEGYELREDPLTPWKNYIKEGMESGRLVTFVADEGGKIIGFVNVMIRNRASFFTVQKMGVIMDTFVREDYRRKGVGSALVHAAERWIKNQGVEVAVLTVAPENTSGVKFWRKKGFKTYLYKQRKELDRS